MFLFLLLLMLSSCQQEVSESDFLNLVSGISNHVEWDACFETDKGIFGTLNKGGYTQSYEITNGCKNRLSGFENSKEFLLFNCEKEKPLLKNNFCISGCFKNACVPLSSCTDSDGGKNFFDMGEIEVTDKAGNKDVLEDACYPGNILGELHCITSYEVGFENYVCPFGCVQGRCLEEKDKELASEDSYGEKIVSFSNELFSNVIPKIATVNDEIIVVVANLEERAGKVQVKAGSKSFQLFDDGFHGDGLARDNVYAGNSKIDEIGNFKLSLSYEDENNMKKNVDLDENLIVIEKTEEECQYFASSESAAKINLVVTAIGYENEMKVLEELVDYKNKFNGIFSVEPFKSNKELFDVWFVSAESSEQIVLPDYLGDVNIADELKKGYLLLGSCNKPNQFNLVVYNSKDKLQKGDDLSYGQYKYAYTFYDPITSNSVDVVHEFVHTFAGLTDEYVTDSVSDYTFNGQCYYSPHVKCFSVDDGEKYFCQETVESYNDCLVNAPWKDYLGEGCGKTGTIDCKPIDEDFNLEVNCFLGCGRQKNLYRSTFSSGMKRISVPFELGLVNEKIVCQQIKNIVGFNKGVCLKYDLS